MKIAVSLTLRERLHVKNILCMVLIRGHTTANKSIYTFVSVLGHRFIELHTCIQRAEPIDLAGQFNCSIIMSGEGQPTQDNYDFMAEKYLFSQERMNVRIFPPNLEAPLLISRIDGLRIGLLSTFGISEVPERALIIRLAETFRAMSSEPDVEIIYSRKGE